MFESNTGLGVSNHYGPRVAGGEKGIVRTAGAQNEFKVNLDESGLPVKFPVGVFVSGVIDDFAGAAVTALTIGGVDVIAATEAAMVEIPAGNTGEIVVTGGGSEGSVLVKFLKV